MSRRVVVVHSSDEMYGSDRILLQVVHGIRQLAGVQVEVWLPDDVPHGATPLCHELERIGVPLRHLRLPVIRRANLRPGGLVGLLRRSISLGRVLRHERFDLVYCMTSACLLAAPIARTVGVPSVVVHVHEMWAGREAPLLRALAHFTDLRITISPAVDRAAALHDPPSVVVDNCVPHPEHPDVLVDDLAPAGGPRPRFVVASRWSAWKGHGTLFEAWERAGCPGHLTVLGGPPPSGPHVDVPALVASVVSRPSTVEIVGEVADIERHVAAADVVVLASDAPEPFGLVIIEAFRQGRAAIASRAGGPADIITDGEDGWLFAQRDPDDLARVFETVSTADLAGAGARARVAYLERYTPELFRDRVASLIGGALDPRRA